MIEKNKNLKDLNTFMVSSVASYFATAQNEYSLDKILESDEWKNSNKKLILGGGSNILFVGDYGGFVLKNEIKGIETIEENENDILVKVGAGENWHDFVMWSVENGYWGIENLAYIPGTVGAAPVQNIGAYGVEVKSSVESIDYVSGNTGGNKNILNKDCDFEYRNSIFKENLGKYIITHVYFRLQKNGEAVLSYGRISEVLDEKRINNPSSKDIAEVIIEIRKSKLPELGEIGTAGSFFKNPIISNEELEKIKIKFPDIRYFDLKEGSVKILAGWLLDELGYKGFQKGNVGNYKNHALIITHNGKGTGEEIYDHIQNIINKVKEVFGIDLDSEVVLLK